MIKNSEALSMSEASDYINKEDRAEVLAFIKNFTKLLIKYIVYIQLNIMI